jgi:hypothetical protein
MNKLNLPEMMNAFKWRLSIAIGLIFLMLTLFVFPVAQISFLGFSKCGRVLSQIESRENFVLSFVEGGYDGVELYEYTEEYRKIPQIKENLDDIWRIGTNNPKCFSNSQRIYIEEFRSKEFLNSIVRKTGWGFKSGKGSYVQLQFGIYSKVKDN